MPCVDGLHNCCLGKTIASLCACWLIYILINFVWAFLRGVISTQGILSCSRRHLGNTSPQSCVWDWELTRFPKSGYKKIDHIDFAKFIVNIFNMFWIFVMLLIWNFNTVKVSFNDNFSDNFIGRWLHGIKYHIFIDSNKTCNSKEGNFYPIILTAHFFHFKDYVWIWPVSTFCSHPGNISEDPRLGWGYKKYLINRGTR